MLTISVWLIYLMFKIIFVKNINPAWGPSFRLRFRIFTKKTNFCVNIGIFGVAVLETKILKKNPT